MAVRVFLDVDGVLNAVPADWPTLLHLWGDIREETGVLATEKFRGYTITFVPQWGEFVTDLVNMGAEVFWLTTWEHRANKFISPMQGIPQLPVLENGADLGNKGWWKFEVVKDAWEHDPIPFVWIDDDLGAQMFVGDDIGALQWISENEIDALPICPDSRLGLSLDDMETAARFVRAHL